ncbi:MAG: VWA-like domain-containing protein [Marinilabiliaceae bacterium]|nr:VWA-like domain-containing protein [Marinilabiliaceae bacterium]
MKNFAEIIEKISNRWFLTEPLLFITLMSHEVKFNPNLKHCVRSGQGRIEYNLELDNKIISETEFEEHLRAEVIRILLRHPYRRHSINEVAYIASNVTLNEIYKFNFLKYKTKDFWKNDSTHKNRNFEFYYRELLNMQDKSNDNSDKTPEGNQNKEKKSDNNKSEEFDDDDEFDEDEIDDDEFDDDEIDDDEFDDDEFDNDEFDNEKFDDEEFDNKEFQDTVTNDTDSSLSDSQQSDISSHTVECSALWEEDDFMDEKLREIVEWANNNMSWGNLPGNLIQHLVASLTPKLDYRKIINSFRASVLKSNKILTRFKPSRRFGFLYMGKKSEFVTNLLIAIDVSASISNEEIKIFYSVINRFFKYGIKSIDVIQFDTEVKMPLTTLKKAQKDIKVHGRGGTSFSPVIEFFENTKKNFYDGLIIFTDGEAEIPALTSKTIRKTLWICSNKENYDTHNRWMKKCGRCCWIE